jgi:hypothetical protein
MPSANLSQDELRRLLSQVENSFVERKSFSDPKGWLKTVTAFANSCTPSQTGVLFVGATDSGEIQRMHEEQNLARVQGSISDVLTQIYPPVLNIQFEPLTVGEDSCLAVIVPGSSDKPHFSGPAYVRLGEKTIRANESCFRELIARHSSKSSAILDWKGKFVTAENRNMQNVALVGPVSGYFEPLVETCDSHSVQLRVGNTVTSVALDRVKIGYDHHKNRLKLEVYPY